MNTIAELRIAHLYGHHLNMYGDRGNILALAQRARWRGIAVEVQQLNPGVSEDLSYFDLFFIGGGQDRQQEMVAFDLQEKKDELRGAVGSGAVILGICGGYQLCGHYYRPHQGPELPGISLVDAWTVAGNHRMIGNIVVERSDGTRLVGFENHSGQTFLGKGVLPLGKVVTGSGNNGSDGSEGVAFGFEQGYVFGTYMHGSLLPKNPRFTDELIRLALKRRFGELTLQPLDDVLEQQAHNYACKLKA